MASEVAQGELSERLVTIEPAWVRHPVIEQGERLLAAIGRPEDKRAGLSEIPEQVVGALTCRTDAGRLEGGEKRVAGQDPATGQG